MECLTPVTRRTESMVSGQVKKNEGICPDVAAVSLPIISSPVQIRMGVSELTKKTCLALPMVPGQSGRLIIGTEVLPDGFGDFTQAINLAKVLKSYNPELDIVIIVAANPLRFGALARLASQENFHVVAYYDGGSRIMNETIRNIMPDFNPYALTPDLVVYFAVKSDLFDSLIPETIPEISIFEYGLVKPSFHLYHQTGFDPRTKGVLFLPSECSNERIESIANQRFMQIIGDLNMWRQENMLSLCYMKGTPTEIIDESSGSIIDQPNIALLKFIDLNLRLLPERKIALTMVCSSRELNTPEFKELLRSHGVNRFIIHKSDTTEEIIIENPIGRKTLTVIDMPFAKKDYQRLLNESTFQDGPVCLGAGGDGTLTDIFSLESDNLFPLFNPRYEFQRENWEQLKMIAKERLNNPELHEYLSMAVSIGCFIESDFARFIFLMHNPKVNAGLADLKHILRDESNLSLSAPAIIDQVLSGTRRVTIPAIEQFEFTPTFVIPAPIIDLISHSDFFMEHRVILELNSILKQPSTPYELKVIIQQIIRLRKFFTDENYEKAIELAELHYLKDLLLEKMADAFLRKADFFHVILCADKISEPEIRDHFLCLVLDAYFKSGEQGLADPITVKNLLSKINDPALKERFLRI